MPLAGFTQAQGDNRYAGLDAPVTAPQHLRRFRSRSGRAMFEVVKVDCLGHSIVVGQGANETTTSTAADQLLKAQRGWVAQLRALIAARLGVNGGEGVVHFGTDEGRWAYSGTHSNTQTFYAGTGTILAAGSTATGSFTFTDVDVNGFWSIASSIPTYYPPSRVTADGTDITPTLLTAAQTSFTVGAGNWANRGNCTPTASTDSGENVLTMTSVASGAMTARTPTGASGFPVTGSQAVFITGEFKAAVTAQLVQVSVNFYDSGGSASGSEVFGPQVTDGTGGYVMSAWLTTAPANAAFASLTARVVATSGASEVHTVRRARVIPVTTLATNGNNQVWKFATAAALSNAAHTLVVEASPNVAPGSGGVALGLGAVTLRTGSAGFRVSRIGKSGITSTQAASADQSANTQQNALMATVDLRSPHLVILMVSANDIGTQQSNGITPATTVANVTTIASRVVSNGGCVLIVTDPNYPTAQTPNAQQDYFDALKAYAAATDHVAYVDINAVWGTEVQAEAAGLMGYATYGIHPVLNGHGDIARIVDRTLFGDRGVNYLV